MIDLVAELDSKKTVVDFKASGSSYAEHEAQLSDQLTAYQLAEPDAERTPGLSPTHCASSRIRSSAGAPAVLGQHRLDSLKRSNVFDVLGGALVSGMIYLTDTSATDRTGALCSNGSCHLGGAAISNLEAYGAGLVNAKRCVNAP